MRSQPRSTRAAIAACTGVLACGLSACVGPMTASHSGNQPRPGIVRGFAAPCAGPPSAATKPITVDASRGGRVVASQTRRYPKATYRLTLKPGRYRISAPGSADPSRVVLVRSGHTMTVNFPDTCI